MWDTVYTTVSTMEKAHEEGSGGGQQTRAQGRRAGRWDPAQSSEDQLRKPEQL